MDRNEYFRIQVCNVCGSEASGPAINDLIHTCNVLKKAAVPFSNEQVKATVALCAVCGHKYLNPVLTDKILNYYYNSVESEYFDGHRQKPSDHRPAETKKFAAFIVANSNGPDILEVGCGLGFLLKQLSHLQFNCFGVEPSAFAAHFAANELGLNIHTGMLTAETYPGKKFNTIILSDVVEHISDINTLFRLLKGYLADDGKIIVLTGDSNSLYARLCGKKWLYLYSWEHISFFNKKSIIRLFENHSLRLDVFKRIAHTGSVQQNCFDFIKTIALILLNAVRLRNEKFYLMAFDHFIAVATNKKNHA